MKCLILKGLDTLEFGLDIENYLLSIESFLNTFSELKENAQKTGIESEISISDTSITVHRTGIRFYAYSLSCNDFRIFFMEKVMKENPPVKVIFSSAFLWSFGFKGALDKFYEWFSAFNLKVIGTRLSRVDICIDSDEIKFVQSDLKGIVTHAQFREIHYVDSQFYQGKKFSGFTFGKGSLHARIYNKTLEIKKSLKGWFYQIWDEAGWDLKKEIWRVEFQLRREVLKELGINSFEDLMKKENSLWIYLTTKFLVIKSPKGENVTRWPIKRKWVIVQKADFNQEYSPLVRQSVLQGNTERLLDQAAGLLLTIAALNNHDSIEETLSLSNVWSKLKLQQKNTTFTNEIELRRNRFISAKQEAIIHGQNN